MLTLGTNLQKGKKRCSKCQRYHKGRYAGVVEPGLQYSVQIIGEINTTLVTGTDLQNYSTTCVVCDNNFERIEVMDSKYSLICQQCIGGELLMQECRKCGSIDDVCILQVRQGSHCEEMLWCLSCSKMRLDNVFTPRMMRIILEGREISDIHICQCGKFKYINVNCTPHQMKPSGLCMDCQFHGNPEIIYSYRIMKCFQCNHSYDCRIGQNVLSCPRCFSSYDVGVGGIFRLPLIVEPDRSLLDCNHNRNIQGFLSYGDDFIDVRDPQCWNNNQYLNRSFRLLMNTCEINTSGYGGSLDNFILGFKKDLKNVPNAFRNIVPWVSKGTRDYFGMALVFLDLVGKGKHLLDICTGIDPMYRVHLSNSLLDVSLTAGFNMLVRDDQMSTLSFGLYLSTDFYDYDQILKIKFDKLGVGGLGIFREFVLDVNVLVSMLVRLLEEGRQCFVYFRSLSSILSIMVNVGYKILGAYRLSDLTSEYLIIVTK